jgi:RND family efflux transporter MFP subunit
MNFESRGLHAATAEAGNTVWIDDTAAETRRRRWMMLAAAVLILAVLAGAYFAMSGGGGEQTAAKGATAGEAASANGADKSNAPTVTVVVPGTTSVERVISSTGTLAARREMPVGVAGEGGQVVRVLVEPGQWVREGQVLATVDRAVQVQQTEQLAAQIRVAEADARLAQSELDRAQALVARGFISQADIERRTAQRDSAAARVRVAQAQLAENRARVGRLDIRAPAAGLVLTRGVEPGQVIGAGSGILFRIARGGEMELLAQVGEADIALLSSGTRATVTPVGSARTFAGQIWQMSPIVDPQSRQGTARIALAYAPGLRPGGFAEARIVAGSQVAPLLPESAVLNDAQGTYVYVVGADNKAMRRTVTAGQITDGGVPVISGLTGQERVVITAGAFLDPGQTVSPVVARATTAAAR